MSTSSRSDREAVGVELREVEDVADEALEPRRLRLDDLERGVRCSGSSTTPSSSAETWPRIAVSGVRSSCETDMRKLRSSRSASASRSAISPNRSARWPISPGARLGHLDVVVPAGDLVGRLARAQHGAHDPPREVPREQRRRRARPSAPAIARRLIEPRHALADVRLLLRDDDRADRLLADDDRFATAR